MLEELRYAKKRNGMWQVSDKKGHVVEGITKEIALNNYILKYDKQDISFNNVDISKFNVKI